MKLNKSLCSTRAETSYGYHALVERGSRRAQSTLKASRRHAQQEHTQPPPRM
jgi:hypothetical protein